MAKQQDYSILESDKTYQNVRAKLEKELREKAFQERQRQLDSRAQNIRDLARKNLIEFGEQDSRTQFAIHMLGVTLAIREFMNRISISSNYLRDINDVISTLDEFINLQENLAQEVSANKNGFFQLLKIKLNARKATRAIKRKIKVTFEVIKIQESIVDAIVGSLSEITKAFKDTKNNIKRKKRNQSSYKALDDIAREIVKNDMPLPAAGSKGADPFYGEGKAAPKDSDEIDISEL